MQPQHAQVTSLDRCRVRRGKQVATPNELREQAAQAEQDAADSFARCDTDGFLSQWASGLSAQRLRLQATIQENGNTHTFVGLFDADGNRVPAKQIQTKFGTAWLLRDDAAVKYGRFVPFGENSRKQKVLGLHEENEVAPAKAALRGTGKGLSGQAWACAVRTGDEWGMDAKKEGE